jgi:hypothetical protein
MVTTTGNRPVSFQSVIWGQIVYRAFHVPILQYAFYELALTDHIVYTDARHIRR